jgi:hypothetical protein
MRSTQARALFHWPPARLAPEALGHRSEFYDAEPVGGVGPLEIGRTEARWTSDDNFVALHHYEKAHGFFPRATSVMPKQRMSFSKGRIARGYSSGTDEHS